MMFVGEAGVRGEGEEGADDASEEETGVGVPEREIGVKGMEIV